MRKHYKVIMMVLGFEDNSFYSYLKKCWLTFKDSHPDVKVFFVYGKGSGLKLKNEHDICFEDLPEGTAETIRKTMYGIEYIDQNFTCDYFIHTNLSTFWRFDKLMERLEKLPKTPFAAGTAVSPGDFSWCQRKTYIYGYNMIMDGKTMSNLSRYKKHMMWFKDHPLTKATIGTYFPDDMMMTVYLLDVLKVPFIDTSNDVYHFRRGEVIDWNTIDERISSIDKDHVRIKTSLPRKDRIGVDDEIFRRLCIKYYGKAPNLKKEHSKAIFLVFANEDGGLFSSLKKCWLTFCHKNPDVKVFFVYGEGSGLGKDPWDLCYEHLPENHRQGIIKVIHAMEYIDENYTCDYFIHTNLSTFWDFENLLKNLDQMQKPFVRSVPAATPKVHGGVYLMGFSLTMDGKTFSRLVTYKDDMIKIKDHPIVKSLVEDKVLSVYLTDVFEMNYIDCGKNQANPKHFVADIDNPNVVETYRQKGVDHYRVKTSYIMKERLGVDDKIFSQLCEKYYGVTIPHIPSEKPKDVPQ